MDPARSVALEISHHGAQGQIELTFEEWQGTRIDIAFRDRLYRNSGVIQFDGRNRRSIITASRPYEGPLADAEEFKGYFNSILNTFAHPYTFGWSPEPEEMVKIEFQHVSTTAKFLNLPEVYSNTGAYNQQWTFWGATGEPASR